MNIEMRHLRYFAAVAEDASFTAAAQRVHVAQQVLSTQIRQLEDAAGVLLLERNSRGLVLTACHFFVRRVAGGRPAAGRGRLRQGGDQRFLG
jgi:hypothetical protein